MRAVLVVGVCGLLLAGCGRDVVVDESLTLAGAHARAVTLAQGALSGLPPGTTLVRQREGDSFTPDDPPGPTGCHPSDDPGADPVAVEVSWAASGGPFDPGAVLAAARSAWEAQGWAVSEPGPGAVRTTTATGDVLTVGARSDDVGVRVVTRCFPRDGGSAAPLPTVLPTTGR